MTSQPSGVRPRRRPSAWIAALAAALALAGASFASGVVLGALDGRVQGSVTAAKAQVRIALGLPKQWNPNVHDDASAHVEASCPDPDEALVVVTGGQSNAANNVSSPLPPLSGVYTFFDGACYATQDPVLGASGTRGSLWTQLGGRLREQSGRPVVFVHGAVGGSAYGDWLDARSGYLARLLGRVDQARAAGFEPDWIVWHQGETDAANAALDAGVLAGEIEALGSQLLEAAPDARLYLFQASRCVGAIRAEGRPEVREAQAAAAGRLPRTVLGLDTDGLDDEHRLDGCHFNALGRDAIVAALAETIGAGRTAQAAPPR